MPSLSITQVLHRLEQGRVDPLYLLFGEETFLTREYTSTLIERILNDAPRDFNCDIFTAESNTLVEALSIASTFPLMASHRVVVLHGIQQLRKADLQQLEQYAGQPVETTTLICSTEQDVNKCPRHFRQQAVAIPCQRLEGSQLHAWLVRTFTAKNYRISDEAAQVLLQEQENDLQVISGEIEKLCTYAGERSDISLEDVQEVCQASRQQSLFALSDAIGTRQIPRVLMVVERLLQQGEPPLVILSMLVRHLRLLWSIQQLSRQHQDIARMAKTIGVPQAVCRQLATQSRLYSPARLRQLYTAAIEADIAFKTSNKPPQAIFEGLIFALCTEG